jgi:predicted nucleic acid-binding protein
MRPTLNSVVVTWLDRQDSRSVWITSITVLEVRSGLLRLPDGQRRSGMLAVWDTIISKIVPNRILPFDTAAAEAAASLAAKRTSVGLNVDTLDTQIAGICMARETTLATRNTRHFEDTEFGLVNPWTADAN